MHIQNNRIQRPFAVALLISFSVDKADNSCLVLLLDFTANTCDWAKGYIPQRILILKQEQSVSEEPKPKITIENPVGIKSMCKQYVLMFLT